MNARIFCCTLLLCPGVLGSFYVSEIFANMPGRLSNKGSAWIELANISEQSIIISHLRFQIFTAASELHFEHQLEVQKLRFEERLVLAEKKELMPGLCLDKRAPYVQLPSFSIPKGRHKICVTINHTLRDCATLSAQDRFNDGVSLYRSHEGSLVHTLWLSEPCHIQDGVFATPGLAERACLRDDGFFKETLSLCLDEAEPFYQRKSKLLVAHESHAPKLTLLNESLLRVEDPDPSDLLLLASCLRPEGAKLLCQETKKPQSINIAQDQHFLAILPPFDHEARFFLKVRDLVGFESSVETPHMPGPSIKKLSELKAEPTWLNDHELKILLPLEKDHVPLNYWLKSLEGDVLMAGAFLSAGEKTLALSTTQKHEALSLVVKTLHEEHTISLNDQDSNGCSTSPIDPWWIVFGVAIIRAFKAKIRSSNDNG